MVASGRVARLIVLEAERGEADGEVCVVALITRPQKGARNACGHECMFVCAFFVEHPQFSADYHCFQHVVLAVHYANSLSLRTCKHNTA